MQIETQDDWATVLACQDVVLRFTSCFDEQNYAAMEPFFAPEGVWHRLEGDIVGVDGLRSHLAQRSPKIRVKHVISNLRTTISGKDSALVESYLTAYRYDHAGEIVTPAPLSGPLLVGSYRDELRCFDGTWKIQRRSVSIDFRRAAT